MTNQELRNIIHDTWQTISYELAMKSEDGRFDMSDICEAFHAGVDCVIQPLGLGDDQHINNQK